MKVGIFRISSKSNSLTEHEIAVIEYLDKHNHEIFIDVDFFKSLALNKNKKPLDINKVDVLFNAVGFVHHGLYQ